MSDGWKSAPWTQFGSDSSSRAICKRQVPYEDGANALQTLDIWVPVRDESPAETPEPEAFPAKSGGLWIIYIHGGAWRDPLVTSASFDATVKHLLSRPDMLNHIGGFASLNYSLSSHPSHPTHPSPPNDPSEPVDPSRTAKHPDHILDVLAALRFLQRKVGFGSNYILAGHSCGATLAFQVAMDRSLWGDEDGVPDTKAVPKPDTILGLNGLYDLPDLISNPGDKHKHLAELYEGFTRLAFGDDKGVWEQVSPTLVARWDRNWSHGRYAFFVQSLQDSLVPYSQTKRMKEALAASKSGELEMGEYEAGGDHNALWQDGRRLADIIEDIVARLKK